jgi:flagellar protein FliO/FliZ
MSTESSLTAWLAFAAIVVAIPFVLAALKRSGLGARLAAGLLRPVAALPLSASQKVVAVEVGSGEERRWLVLGVTQTNISLLTIMAPQAEPAATPAMPAANFAQLLARLKKGDTDAR